MVDSEIIDIVRAFMSKLPDHGIHPVKAVLFGSYVKGKADEWSDIDVLIIAPEFDEQRPVPLDLATRLWTTASSIDLRLEALPCGVKEWNAPHIRTILNTAAEEGIQIAA